MRARHLPSGGYWFLPSIRAYSAGVAADREHELVRIALDMPLPLERAAELIPRFIGRDLGRPVDAICAIELRSPLPMSYGQFAAFNRRYTSWLELIGLTRHRETPVARTNVVPSLGRIDGPVVHAFTVTVPSSTARLATFVTAGAAESSRLSARTVVSQGETSLQARMAKCRFVIKELSARMEALGVPPSASDVTVYAETVPTTAMIEEIVEHLSPGTSTVTYCYSRPPVAAVEFEMDVRRVASTTYI
jgi:hypothetical protein